MQTINEPIKKNNEISVSLNNIFEKKITKIIVDDKAKLLCKLSIYFITSEIKIPPNPRRTKKFISV